MRLALTLLRILTSRRRVNDHPELLVSAIEMQHDEQQIWPRGWFPVLFGRLLDHWRA